MNAAAMLIPALLAAASPWIAAEPDRDAASSAIPLSEIQRMIDNLPPGHPRLFADRNDFARLRGSLDRDPGRRALADAVIRQADGLQTMAPIERTLQGRRLLGESRRCVKRTVLLGMAYQLTGDDKYARRGREEMLAVARFPDWNPSHFLDVAEMTFALALGYDWLFDGLDESSRTEIRKAIVDKGVNLPFTTRHHGWVRASNNWGQVCHGGLTAGALAVHEDEPELAAKTVHNALQNVTYSMRAYSPNGSYPEGPGYWAYGTSYNVVLIGVLESVLGTDGGLSRVPGFRLTGQYPALVCGPSGLFFNYADGGATRRPAAALFWLSARFDRPDWLLGERERLKRGLARTDAADLASGKDRLLPLALLWMKPDPPTLEYRMPLHWQSGGETPIAIHRSSWTDPDAVFLGLKAGSPSANHGQMDTGSFVLDADGVRWALDLGAEGYHGIESRGMNLWSRAQDSDRWTIFRQRNHGHNTLVIDDQLQVAKGHAKIVKFSDDPTFPHSIADLTPVYAGQAKSIKRGVALLPTGQVLLQDEFEDLHPGSRVRWSMISPATPTPPDDRVLKLHHSDRSLSLAILSPEHGAAWDVLDTANPRHDWDSPNPGTRMVALEAVAPKSGRLTIAVLFTPGSCAANAQREAVSIPLSAW